MLCLTAFVFLSQEKVQTQIAQNFTQSLNDQWATEFKIDRASIQWNGNLRLQQFLIRDHQQDTLLYIDALETSLVSFQRALDGNLEFSNLRMSQGRLKVIHYPEDSLHSLDLFLQKFKLREQRDQPLALHVNELSGSDFRLSLIDLKGIKTHQQIDQLSFDAQKIDLHAGVFQTELNHLDFVFREKEGRLAAQLNYGKNTFRLDTLALQYGNVALQGNLQVAGLIAKDPLIQFQLNGQVQELSDWFPELPKDFPQVDNRVELQGSGTLDSLGINRLLWQSKDHQLGAQIDLKQWTSAQAQAAFQIDSLEFNSAYIRSLSDEYLPSKFPIALPENLRLRGAGIFRPDSLQLEFAVLNPQILLRSKTTFQLVEGMKAEQMQSQLSGSIAFTAAENYYPQQLNVDLNIRGKALSQQPVWEFDGGFEAQKFLKHDQWNVFLDGGYEKNRLELRLNNRSTNSSSEVEASLNLKNPEEKQSVAFLFLGFDPEAYGLHLGSQNTRLNGLLQARWQGFDWDNLQGELTLDQLSVKTGDTVAVFKPLALQLQQLGNRTQLDIQSEDILKGKVEGAFRLSDTQALFQKTANEAFPFIFPAVTPPKGNLSFNLQLNQKILKALYPDIEALQNFSCKGVISDRDEQSRIRVRAPFFSMGQMSAYNLELQIENKNVLYNAYMHADSIQSDQINLSKFDIISKQIKDTLYFKGEMATQGPFKSQWSLNAFQTQDSLNRTVFGLKPSSLNYLDKTWQINPRNRDDHLLTLAADNQPYELKNLEIAHEEENLRFQGNYLDPKNFDFNANITRVDLSSLYKYSEFFKVQGKLDAEATLLRSENQQGMSAAFELKELNINREPLGNLIIQLGGNLETDTYQMAVVHRIGDKIPLRLESNWLGRTDPAVEATLTLEQFPIDFISPLGKNKLTDITGNLSGGINIWGRLDELEHLGQLQINDARLHLPYTNVDYSFANDARIDLVDQRLLLQSVKVTNELSQTTGLIKGAFTHENFHKWFLDLEISTDRLLIINRENEPNALFYGPGYFKGQASLNGYTKTPQLQLKGETQEGTSIVIPYDKDYTVADVSFIDFVDKNRLEEVVETEEVLLEKLRGLEMQFDLDINQAAEIEIVLDPESGSSLKGRGAGNLLMEVNTNGKFNMWGDYIAIEGVYNFQNLGLIDKRFTLKPGGTIVWEGDPLEAQMNLEAVYEVPGGANPAVLLDNPNFSQKIPTQVGIQLQGNLLKPDDPNFTIEFPNTNQTVSSEINYRLADDQRRQLQAISLLSQGIFINDVSLSVEGITNNLYEKASDVFSNIIGQENEKLKVGLNYLQGDETLTQQLYAEDRLGLTLSTQISDKILVNGRIGVPVGGVEQTLLVGDVQIDFILSDDGSLRAKVFNKENEFRYLSDRLGYTQGIGLNYQVDFETFRDLIQKIIQTENIP